MAGSKFSTNSSLGGGPLIAGMDGKSIHIDINSSLSHEEFVQDIERREAMKLGEIVDKTIIKARIAFDVDHENETITLHQIANSNIIAQHTHFVFFKKEDKYSYTMGSVEKDCIEPIQITADTFNKIRIKAIDLFDVRHVYKLDDWIDLIQSDNFNWDNNSIELQEIGGK